MAIITLSKTAGTLAEEIARAAAKELNYSFVDKEVAAALSAEGFSQQDQDAFNEKGLSFWEFFSLKRDRFKYSIKTVVLECAQRDNLVLYGWGAQALLKNIPGVLRVRVYAPHEVRLQRITRQQGCDRATAEKIIGKKDHDSAGFIRSFYNYDWEDSTLYDLMLNTATISVNTGVKLITKTLAADEFTQHESNIAEQLTALTLTHRIQAALDEIPGAGTINFSHEDGNITLTGMTNSQNVIRECEEAVSDIIGNATLTNSIRLLTHQL